MAFETKKELSVADDFLWRVPQVVRGTKDRRAVAEEAAKVFTSVKRRKGTAAAEAAVTEFLQRVQEAAAESS